MQGLKIRIARRINRALGRAGKVWTDRYHAKALATPRQVRFGIRYVLSNWLKHINGARGLDPYSSARWFRGWTTEPPAQGTRCPASRARTWLAARGWKRHGLIRIGERPGKRDDLPPA